MSDLILKVVQGGTANLGGAIEVQADRPITLGGSGSASDHELVELPGGVKFLRFSKKDDTWIVEELSDAVVKLDGQTLRRTNNLQKGAILSLPRGTSGTPLQLEVSFRKTRGSLTLPTFRSIFDGVGYYVVVALVFSLVGSTYFWIINDTASQEERPPSPQELVVDLKQRVLDHVPDGVEPIFGRKPRTLAEVSLAASVSDNADAIAAGFAEEMVALIAEARHLESIGLTADARIIYEDVAERIGDPTSLAASKALSALQRMN